MYGRWMLLLCLHILPVAKAFFSFFLLKDFETGPHWAAKTDREQQCLQLQNGRDFTKGKEVMWSGGSGT